MSQLKKRQHTDPQTEADSTKTQRQRQTAQQKEQREAVADAFPLCYFPYLIAVADAGLGINTGTTCEHQLLLALHGVAYDYQAGAWGQATGTP